MIPFKSLSFILTLLILMGGCSTENDFPIKKNYPVIETKDPININETGVTLMARVISNSLTIEDYGFILEGDGEPYKISLADRPLQENMEIRVSGDLKKDTKYVYQAYMKFRGLLVLGNEIAFTSRGSRIPEITDFNPKNGDSGDIITVSGENFSIMDSRLHIKLGDDNAEVVSVRSNEVKFVVPKKLTISGEVPISLTSGDTTLVSKDLFSVGGHLITDFHPKRGIIGETEIEILGAGFHKEIKENKIFFDEYQAEVISADENKLRVKLPYTMHSGDLSVNLTINGRTSTSNELIEVVSRWSKRNRFPSFPTLGGYFTVLDGVAYLIGGRNTSFCCGPDFSSEVWQYDIENDQWTQLEDFPGGGRSFGIGFTLNNKIYYGLGEGENQIFTDFWEFNPKIKTWVRLNDFPENIKTTAIYFSLNNVGYVIGGNGFPLGRAVWRYDIDSDFWTKMGNTNSHVNRLDGGIGFFQHKNEGYLIYSSTMLKFDPNHEGFLKEEASFSLGNSNGEDWMFSFIIDDMLYIGRGSYYAEDQGYNLWKFNFESKELTQKESFLGEGRSLENSFSYNGLGFAMFGQSRYCCYSANTKTEAEVWIYDPSIK